MTSQKIALDDDAREVLLDFAQEVEAMLAPGGRLDSIADWGSKLPGSVARISALVELAGTGATARKVRKDTMVCAVVFGRVLIEHALETLVNARADKPTANALAVLEWLRTERRVEVTTADLDARFRGRLRNRDDINATCGKLTDWGVLSGARQRKNPSARATTFWLVSPRLYFN